MAIELSVYAFALTAVLTPAIGRLMMRLRVVGRDVNKENGHAVPEHVGIAFVASFSVFFLMLVYAYGKVEMLWALAAALAVSAFGLADYKFAFKPRVKLVFPFVAGLMLMPAIYQFDGGWKVLYAILLAAGFMASSNFTNMLGGFNGIEAGMSALASAGLAVFFYLQGYMFESYSLLLLFACLAGFLLYNLYPASVFPGDSGTMFCGAVIASIVLLSPYPYVLPLALAPHIADAWLKFRSAGVMSRSDFKPVVLKKGRLYLPKKGYRSLARHFLRKPLTEPQLVARVLSTEVLVVLLLALWGWLA
ncbi:MAG: hypothetical protein ABH829_00935 [archaeon]